MDKTEGRAATSRLADAAGANCAMTAKPKTVGDLIGEAIEEHNRHIARLMQLKAEAQARGFLHVPQQDLAQFAYPDSNVIF